MEEMCEVLTAMSDEQRQEAMRRFEVVRGYFEDGVSQAELARCSGVPLKTVQRWVRRYREHGLAGLGRRGRRDAGQRRGLPQDELLLIEGLALQVPRRSVATIHRQVCEVARQKGWPCPSYRRVCLIVRDISPSLMVLSQQGKGAQRDQFDLIVRREAQRPNEMWQADHVHLKVWVLDEEGQPVRPWLTVILDDYSRSICGFRLTVSAPTALHSALTLRQAILRKEQACWEMHGIPKVFYTDHGRDFTSEHVEQVAADLSMQVIFSRQGKPRGRGKLERFFETVEQLLLQRLPGYAPAERGQWPDEREKRNEQRASEARLSVAAFERCFEVWVVEEYHQRVHSELGCTPAQRWVEGGFVPLVPRSVEQLDLLLLTVPRERKVRREGIAFEGYWYTHPNLTAYVGEQVVIRYDPADMGEIRVFYERRFLCRAICQELAGEEVSLKDLELARKELRRYERGELRERKKVVKRLTKPVAVEWQRGGETRGGEKGPGEKLKRYEHE